jgi:hypothetical protein
VYVETPWGWSRSHPDRQIDKLRRGVILRLILTYEPEKAIDATRKPEMKYTVSGPDR